MPPQKPRTHAAPAPARVRSVATTTSLAAFHEHISGAPSDVPLLLMLDEATRVRTEDAAACPVLSRLFPREGRGSGSGSVSKGTSSAANVDVEAETKAAAAAMPPERSIALGTALGRRSCPAHREPTSLHASCR